ncbi:VOC family protein [Pseudonocardia hierapolitana]|uniref:VOC family protein n=1 Tax=Pseudonocardia hierapolitana TaxID=1128676 RepID=UPI0011BEFB0D|nr:VOC family protein [Pseudonocardia hierapolitana]
MIRHVSTVAVYVTDQDEALRFWTGKVGFELRAEWPMGDARWLEVAPPGAASALVLHPKAMMPDWETRRPGVVFEVEDIEVTCSRLAAEGVSFAKPLTEMPWGRFASFLDTEGNEFGLRE